MLEKKDIIETKVEIKNDIKYTTIYVDRPARQGDPMGGDKGAMINDVNKVIEVIKYVYKIPNDL